MTTVATEYSIEKPALNGLLQLLGRCGYVHSFFLKSKHNFLHYENGSYQTLKVLENFEFIYEKLGTINCKIKNFAMLNRLEFEGSLVSVILEGGCHGMTSDVTRENASHIVTKGLDTIIAPQYPDQISAFRIDDSDWCTSAQEATVTHAYIVSSGLRNLWWILCIMDYD